MKSRIVALGALAILLAPLLAGPAVFAQQAPTETEYEPTVGQPGKDVIWVPTPDELVERMLMMANVGPTDYVIDLGSGDGRTVIMAAQKFGARAKGIEYNPDMVALSIRNAEAAGVSDKVEFVHADIFETDFSDATVVTLYLLPSLNLKLRPTILDMRPGTRVVSNSFDMDEWEPDETVTETGRHAHFWIVPAKVAGNWRLTIPTEGAQENWTLTLDQEFQKLSGRVGLPGAVSYPIEGSMRGAEIEFHFTDANGTWQEFKGSVSDDRIDGTSSSWSAERQEVPTATPRT